MYGFVADCAHSARSSEKIELTTQVVGNCSVRPGCNLVITTGHPVSALLRGCWSGSVQPVAKLVRHEAERRMRQRDQRPAASSCDAELPFRLTRSAMVFAVSA
jgi:hypothetical protein